jgi:DNA-binding transcriptional LysR family regulator
MAPRVCGAVSHAERLARGRATRHRQASASVMLRKLRRHFGDELFVRTSRGMEPTPHAQALYPDLLEVVERMEHVRGRVALFAPSTAQRTFRICMTDISEIVLLPSLLNRLSKEAPEVVIEAVKVSVDSQRQLESADLDLAVGFMPTPAALPCAAAVLRGQAALA